MGLFNSRTVNKPKKKQEVEEEQEEEEELDYYCYVYECDNCGESKEYEIPCKTKAVDFLKDKKCKECECNVV